MENELYHKKHFKNNILIFTGVLFLLFWLIGAGNNNIWYDESFTMGLLRHNFGEMLKIASYDVHPPFYYILSKGIVSLFGENLMALRGISLLFILLTAVAVKVQLKGQVSEEVIFWLSMMILCLPTSLKFSLEMRMYAVGIFFVAEVMINLFILAKDETDNFKRYFAVLVSSTLAAYTHYYAILAIVMLYALFFINRLINRKAVKYIIIVGVINVLLYLPWVNVLWSQTKTVADNYWIKTVDIVLIAKCFLFPFAVEQFLVPSAIVALIYFFIMIAALVGIVKAEKSYRTTCIYCVLVPILMFVVSLSVSLLVQPVIQPRYFSYAYVSVGMALAIGLSCLNNDKVKRIIAVLLLAGLLIEGVFQIQIERKNGGNEYQTAVENILENGGTIVCNDNTALGITSYYMKDSAIYGLNEYYAKALECFNENVEWIDSDEIKNMKSVYLITASNRKVRKEISKKYSMEEEQQIVVEEKTYIIYRID